MTSYKAHKEMENEKATARNEFSINNPIADSIKNQVQTLYGIIKDYADKVLEINDSIKKSYNNTMNTIDNVVDNVLGKYINKKKELKYQLQPYLK